LPRNVHEAVVSRSRFCLIWKSMKREYLRTEIFLFGRWQWCGFAYINFAHSIWRKGGDAFAEEITKSAYPTRFGSERPALKMWWNQSRGRRNYYCLRTYRLG
jgi:hypothetical protein